MAETSALSGRSVFVIEDDCLVATDLGLQLGEAGANVIGPAGNLEVALRLLEQFAATIDIATVDINVAGEPSYPIARALHARGIPFVFVSAYDSAEIPEEFLGVPVCEKPIRLDTVVHRVAEHLNQCESGVAQHSAVSGWGATMASPAGRPGLLRGKEILIVEDDDQLYRAMHEMVTDAGGKVLGAVAFLPKGAGVLPLAHIDLAIIDVPRTGTAIALAGELHRRGIPSVFIGSVPLPRDKLPGLHYLPKPFSEQQLLNALHGLPGLDDDVQAVSPKSTKAGPLSSLRSRAVLLIEDEYMVAMDMYHDLENAGATVVGPVASVEDALALLEDAPLLDAAVVDVRLRGEDAFAVADALGRQAIPYIFASGSARAALPERFRHVPWCAKPFNVHVLADAIDRARG